MILLTDRRFRRYPPLRPPLAARLGTIPQPLEAGAADGGTLTFEVSIFNAAAFAMGLISPTAVAAYHDRHPARLRHLHGADGRRPGGDGARRRAFGSGDLDGIGRAGSAAFLLGIGFMALTALMFVLMPGPLIAIFLDLSQPANAEVVQLATAFLVWAAIFQLVDGAQAVGNGLLRGLHDTRVPMIYALIGYWGLGFPLGLLLAFKAGFGGGRHLDGARLRSRDRRGAAARPLAPPRRTRLLKGAGSPS